MIILIIIKLKIILKENYPNQKIKKQLQKYMKNIYKKKQKMNNNNNNRNLRIKIKNQKDNNRVNRTN